MTLEQYMNKCLIATLAILSASLLLAGGCDKLNKALSGIPGKVQGQCLDTSGGPRGYISVVLKKVDTGEEKYQQNAEDSGNFFFDEVEPGRYQILTYLVGKKEVPNDTKEINVTPGKTVMQNVTVLDAKPDDASAGG
jgi:hypothetical protein